MTKTRVSIHCAAAMLATVLVGAAAPAGANDSRFPFDLELLMETAPMRPAKRVPSITVSTNGMAQIDLWCRSVRGRVALGEGTIAIEAEPLSDTLPAMMSRGQCTGDRMRADEKVLAELVQATSWRRRGQTVEFIGPATLRFRPSDH